MNVKWQQAKLELEKSANTADKNESRIRQYVVLIVIKRTNWGLPKSERWNKQL
jgi:hypothetical protein